MIFFTLIANVVVSFAYIIYVFFYLRISQDIPRHGVEKGEYFKVKMIIGNEGILPFSSIKLNYIEEFSEVYGNEGLHHFGLNSKESIEIELKMICNYSGTYYVGVESIEIMDYFGIFMIKFSMPQKIKVFVSPRVLEFEKLSFLDDSANTINSSNSRMGDAIVDNQTRIFQEGDDTRLIHWKNSAKTQKLMIRTYGSEESERYVVILDGCINEKDWKKKIIVADKLRETFVSIVRYLFSKGYSVECYVGDCNGQNVNDLYEFGQIYEKVSNYYFTGNSDVSGLINQVSGCEQYGETIICVSSHECHNGQNNYDSWIFWLNVEEYEKIMDIGS